MSQQPFPGTIDVKKFFSRRSQLTSVLPRQSLKRLGQYLHETDAENGDEIEVKLDFIQDDEGRFILGGAIQGNILLSCQRCLQAAEYKLDSDFSIQIVDELKAAGDRELAEDELDVAVSVDGKLDLLALIEDEVILSLPLVIYHDDKDCNQKLTELQTNEEQGAASKPFAELAALKSQLNLAKSSKDSDKEIGQKKGQKKDQKN
jgi:uncharacterized protein